MVTGGKFKFFSDVRVSLIILKMHLKLLSNPYVPSNAKFPSSGCENVFISLILALCKSIQHGCIF